MAKKNWKEKDEKWLIGYFQWWAENLGQHPLQLKFCFQEKPKDDTDINVSRNYPYRGVTINIYPNFWEDSRKRQEQAILHEVFHLVLWEISYNRLSDKSFYDDQLENCIEVLALSVYGIYNQAMALHGHSPRQKKAIRKKRKATKKKK